MINKKVFYSFARVQFPKKKKDHIDDSPFGSKIARMQRSEIIQVFKETKGRRTQFLIEKIEEKIKSGLLII